LPASGWEMIANVRRLATSRSSSLDEDEGENDSDSDGVSPETGLTPSLYSVADSPSNPGPPRNRT